MFNFYGFFIAIGVFVGAFVVKKLQKKLPVFDILPYLLIPGIVGARLYHVIDYWQYYSENLGQIIAVWHGGLGIFGGILGGFFGLWFCLKLKFKKANFLSFLDLGVIGLSIGQAIGRWGNFFNQELYGLPTDLPWGIFIEGEKYHPLFFYESIGCLIIFIIIIKIIKRKKVGITFFTYLFLYSFLRFWLEFLRIERWWINQTVALILMLVSGFALLKKSDRIKFKQ